jgi:hypothetical protein
MVGTRPRLSYDTIADNSADHKGGGIWVGPQGKVRSIDSIFSNANGGNVSVGTGGKFHSLGHNLFSDAPHVRRRPTDLIKTNPRLGPLADNGGPTMTMALLPHSRAINAGARVHGVRNDQRSVHRPQRGVPDMGAFEFVFPRKVFGRGCRRV